MDDLSLFDPLDIRINKIKNNEITYNQFVKIEENEEI